MIDFGSLETVSADDIKKLHSKTLYRSICVPSMTQSYSLCIQYMKNWFLSKLPEGFFKDINVDGKYVFADTFDMLKVQKPSLVITPSISWDFNNEQIDSYPYGMQLYTRTGRFKNSFFNCNETNSHLGIGMMTILMPFTFKVRLETRAQQLDIYSFLKMACRVGFTCGEDTDLDFHVPYPLMVQIAKDNGFEVHSKQLPDDQGTEDTIMNVPEFLHWLNLHSSLPFLYKFRALNGNNEFFIRMRNMYVHVRSMDMTADDGEREGQLTNNFTIELSTEVRFPAPQMYAYYSDNAHKLQTVYGAWYQPNGPISTCYTFKGTDIPDKNKYGWPLYMSTTYEDNECVNKILEIPFAELLEKDMGECVKDCLAKGVSPAIFCDLIFFNGGRYVEGKFNWETLTFTSKEPVNTPGTYIGVYLDNGYISNYVLSKTGKDDRLKTSDVQYRDQK